MKVKNLTWLVWLGALAWALSACGSGNTTVTPPPTRNATQTPWIIYVPVTTTPEPATVTPFPTVDSPGSNPGVRPTATRTPTRASAPAAAKPAATATRPPAAATTAPTAAPVACNLGSVTLVFPDNNAPRKTKRSAPASDTFDLRWTPYQPGEGDAQVGYRIDLESKSGSKVINSDSVFVSHNWFIQNNQRFIYDAQRIHNLAAPSSNDEVSVTWKVTVVKTTGSFDNHSRASGNVIPCGAASELRVIRVEILDQ